MGATASVAPTKVNLVSFKNISGENFHQEVFDAYKDEYEEIDKDKMSELINFAARVSRIDEVYNFFVKNAMLLNKAELFEVVSLLGHTPSDTDFTDSNKDKKSVSIVQFVKLMNNKFSKVDGLIYDAFRMFDTDQSGFISPEELKVTLLQLSNGSVSQEEVESIIRVADVDKDGQINLDEFIKHVYPHVLDKIKQTDKAIFDSFRLIDSNNNGLVSPDEFREFMLQVSNGQVDVVEINKLIESADVDKDGMINLEEFKTKLYPSVAKQIKRIDNAVLEAFRVFDLDKNGFISNDEFNIIIPKILKGEVTAEKMNKLVSDADLNKDGKIDIDEFKKTIYPLVAEKMRKIDQAIISAFRKFDLDKSGLITPDEITKILKDTTKGEVDDSEISRIVSSIDIDGDGNINIAEFKKNYYENKVKLLFA